MAFTVEIALAALVLMAGMLGTFAIGHRQGERRLANTSIGKLRGVVETPVFSVLGLLLAFAFYGANGRLDYHRQLTVDEANAISTAYLRIDLLPRGQDAVRASFRAYLDTRIELYRQSGEDVATVRGRAATAAIQAQIWREANAACPPADCPAATANLVYASLNTMFDLATKQMISTRLHPPEIVFAMLFVLALVGTFLIGFDLAGVKPKAWAHILTLPVLLSLIFFVILDVEFPRRGVIRLDDYDQLFTAIRARM